MGSNQPGDLHFYYMLPVKDLGTTPQHEILDIPAGYKTTTKEKMFIWVR